MPTELALLPMVESAYNPMAYSSSHASGLWQFIPSTGKYYNLQQNWWHDQRRDVLASTSAALDYLQYIYELHGDWHLTLASYNWGEGAVSRAIARNKVKGLPTDYASLALPNETRHYIPKLQALKNIFSSPHLATELDFPQIPNQPYFHTLVMENSIDVKLAARFAGLSTEEFIALNPAHNLPVIQADSTLVIPVDRVEQFKAGLEAHDEPLSIWRTYALRPGEKLEQIAPRFGITLAALKKVNGLYGRIKVNPGHPLLVPARKGETEIDEQFIPDSIPGAGFSVPTRFHQVRKGDTLSSIARKYDVSITGLKRLNHLTGSAIKPGMRLVVASSIPAAASERSAPARQQAERQNRQEKQIAQDDRQHKAPRKIISHIIKKGDTLFSIARRYKVDLADLKRWNRLTGTLLKVGATLNIRSSS
jgi:membrane-bound lytic murein transglycosylase D